MKHVEEVLAHALSGTGAHVETATVFAGLDWKLAGVRPKPGVHTINEVLHHVIFWQDWVVTWLNGHNPSTPRHASGSWSGPERPANRREWDRAVRRFRTGLEALARGVRESGSDRRQDGKSRLEMLHTIASHNSYHAGQVVFLRQMLDAWPPPSGGLTW